MTTIAWDGKEMAGDMLAVVGGNIKRRGIIKVHRLKDGGLFGFCGELQSCLIALDWMEEGRQDPRPALDTDFAALHVEPDGRVWRYEDKLVPMAIKEKQWAIGSGAQFALGAMLMKADALSAVRAASVFDPYTGGETMTLALNDSIDR